MAFWHYRNSLIKIRRSDDRLIFIIEIPMHGKRPSLYSDVSHVSMGHQPSSWPRGMEHNRSFHACIKTLTLSPYPHHPKQLRYPHVWLDFARLTSHRNSWRHDTFPCAWHWWYRSDIGSCLSARVLCVYHVCWLPLPSRLRRWRILMRRALRPVEIQGVMGK